MLTAFLITLRDVLIATALAWVGVTVETRDEARQTCAQQSCEQTQR